MHRKFLHGEEKTVLYRAGKSEIIVVMISEEGQEFMENIQEITESIQKFKENIQKFMENIQKFMEEIGKIKLLLRGTL
jgi:GMP synthase PP-ATPase subunit